MDQKNEKTRIVHGQLAVRGDNGSWVTPDGKKWWFCASPHCRGLRWKASNTPHPTTCNFPDTTGDA